MAPVLTLAEQEDDYHRKLKHDMKRQDARRFLDPDSTSPLKGLYVIYVWRKRGTMKWLLAGFQRLKPTPARALRWRKKLRIKRDEIMRIVELDIAVRVGAGNPPVRRQRDRVLDRAPAPLRMAKVKKLQFKPKKSAYYNDTVPVRAARTRRRKVRK